MRSLDPRRPTVPSSTPARAVPRAAPRRALALACAFGAALSTSACSVSYPLFGADKEEVATGSIGRTGPSATAATVPTDKVTSAPLAPPSGLAPQPETPALVATPSAYAPSAAGPAEADRQASGLTAGDWTYARGALGLAMTADVANASVPWANPDSGAYGSFTASAAPKTEGGATCRPFSASHSASGREQRLEGTACRTAAGYWEAVAIRSAAGRTS